MHGLEISREELGAPFARPLLRDPLADVGRALI